MQERLGHDEFFARLAELLAGTKEHGTVNITQKRLSYDPTNPPLQKQPRVSKSSKSKTKPISKNTLPSYSPSDLSDISSLLDFSSARAAAASPTSTTITTPDPEPSEQFQLLIRATNSLSNRKEHKGKHIKLATVVDGDPVALEGFFTKLAETSKAGMTALKKRDKKKKKKKEKQKAKKQKQTAGAAVS